jgi:hypothetical protein
MSVVKRNSELLALITCGYVIGLSWILQRVVTTNVAGYRWASGFLSRQHALEPMAIYGIVLIILKTALLYGLARDSPRTIGVLLSVLTAFWFFIAISSAWAVISYTANGPGAAWFNFTHARNTLAGFGLTFGFGLWHYFAAARNGA